jgi:ABC-type siderophore export system fused ATPase/permease subunit
MHSDMSNNNNIHNSTSIVSWLHLAGGEMLFLGVTCTTPGDLAGLLTVVCGLVVVVIILSVLLITQLIYNKKITKVWMDLRAQTISNLKVYSKQVSQGKNLLSNESNEQYNYNTNPSYATAKDCQRSTQSDAGVMNEEVYSTIPCSTDDHEGGIPCSTDYCTTQI